ncbi:MAG: response regulator transcription factor [Burkholderiales bacterium]|jgi:two-component system, NarL family, invasion response regulator UvrY|nr:response regulator transcription factor [Burkholderiales bacterium]
MTTIRVLVVDDHPLITESLAGALTPYGISHVTAVSDGTKVLERFEQERPDVLVLDVWIGPVRGLEVARELLQRSPGARIVIYSQFDKDQFVLEAYRVGAKSFIPKSATTKVLAEAIQKAHEGETYFTKELAERMALMSVRGEESPQAKLTDRELKVFRLMALGQTNAEIAKELSLSSKTIGIVTQAIKETLGVQRLADITRLALKYQLIDE